MVSCVVMLLTGVGRVQRFALWFVDVGVVAAAAARRQVASRLVESARFTAVRRRLTAPSRQRNDHDNWSK